MRDASSPVLRVICGRIRDVRASRRAISSADGAMTVGLKLGVYVFCV